MSTPYITVEDIQKVYTIPIGIDPQAFIDQAHLFITEDVNMPYSQERLAVIELYLAIYFIESYEPQSVAYAGIEINQASLGQMLSCSFYGQKALMFDTQGYLAGVGRKKARIFSVGNRSCGF